MYIASLVHIYNCFLFVDISKTKYVHLGYCGARIGTDRGQVR